MLTKIKKYLINHPTIAEILRFLIIGGIATLIDMFLMGTTIYLFQPENYPHFYNVFWGGKISPSTISTVVGTSIGFISGLLFNYFFSIIFVFINKGNSKSATGFSMFAVLSFLGLLIHLLGMYIGYDLLKLNEWVIKIFLTLVVLVYNYLTRKFIIFKKLKGENINEGK